MGYLYIWLGPWIDGGKFKRTEILMFIGQLSNWALTSFVPSILWEAVLWCDATPVSCSFHSFWPIPTFFLQNVAAYWNFLIKLDKNWYRWSRVIEPRRMQTISLYLQLQGQVISKKLQPLFPLMPTPNQFRSKVSVRITQMLSAFSNEPPHRIGSGDTNPEPIYMQMAMRSTAEWGFGRPTSFACETGHARTSMFLIYIECGWHIKSTRKRSADLWWCFKPWR